MAAVSSEGVLRAAMTALYANGGFEVVLRLPGLAVSGNDAEQLGLATPAFQDVPVGPAVWRRTASTSDLLLGAHAVSELLGTTSFESAQEMFQAAVGIVVGDVVYALKGSDVIFVAGTACAYRLVLERPLWA